MRTVLIADDNAANRELMRTIFEPSGLRVIEASNGTEALRTILEKLPDIALLDIQMPELDGVAVLDALRAYPLVKRIPIVALTAFAMDGDRERFLAAGFDAYVAKPFRVRALMDLIETLLTDWSGANEIGDSTVAGR